MSASSWASLPPSLGPAQLHTGTQRQSRFRRKSTDSMHFHGEGTTLAIPYSTPCGGYYAGHAHQQMRKPRCRKQAMYVNENNDPVAKGALELNQNGTALSIHFPCDLVETAPFLQFSLAHPKHSARMLGFHDL